MLTDEGRLVVKLIAAVAGIAVAILVLVMTIDIMKPVILARVLGHEIRQTITVAREPSACTSTLYKSQDRMEAGE